MLYLLLLMFERLAIIVMVAFLMTRVRYFRSLIEERNVTNIHRFVVMLMFGLFGIIGTYTGLVINMESLQASKWSLALDEDEAIANSRVIGVVVGGLIGGWKVGLGAGLIAGIHRYTLGGFTAFACGLSTIVAGLIAGLAHRILSKRSPLSPEVALVIGFVAETIQMLMILLLAKPFDAAYELVQTIGLPMIIANGIGSALFILIIRNVFQEEEKMGAIQAQKSLLLAKLTTSHLRQGLTEQSARATCTILLNEVQAAAVSITDRHNVLAKAGVGATYHQEEIHKVLEKGQLFITNHLDNKENPHVAVSVPLKDHDKVIGTLTFYFKEDEVKTVTIEFIKGLASLLSHQLQIANTENYYQLAKEAEIKALQAQVSPHFLFNTLNTAVSMIRTEPFQARKLLVSLSRYFHHNMAGVNETFTPLSKELEHVKAYLDIESARFKDKLRVSFDVDPSLLRLDIPPLTLQPIVENALKHGFIGVKSGSYIQITMKHLKEGAHIVVEDNGVGIDEEKLQQLTRKPTTSTTGTGLGLLNVNKRLTMLFGDDSLLHIQSQLGYGTRVSFYLPALKKSEEDQYELSR